MIDTFHIFYSHVLMNYQLCRILYIFEYSCKTASSRTQNQLNQTEFLLKLKKNQTISTK